MKSVAHLQSEIAAKGFSYAKGASQMDLVEALEGLGTPIYVEEVRHTPGTTSLVKSRSAIAWHTDHHRARRILWYGLGQTSVGGETLVVDGWDVLARLSPSQVAALYRVNLFEHSVFRGDPPRHPLLRNGPNGRPCLYFSLWLADGAMNEEERDAFDAFAAAIDRVEHRQFRIVPGDILAIDNTRMLHARTKIAGTGVRHLRRYWLSA